ncbi:MAG: DUF3080 domain-containing protein [Gammaproteobacteria bacterium HGW-Gammaproteobacteria-6]|nr:MAG: DUF3080 domain-containing protein [Gammaproteobacteria bacterium HGW-Gammaproteobacteria-6]
MRARLLLCLLAWLLSACERTPEANRQLDNYLERVGRVLDQPVQPFEVERLSQYRLPERRLRLLEIPEQRIGLLELLVESRRCQTLQQRVSERNSSLGKVMPWQHRLAFDGALIQAIDDCLQVLAEDEDRAQLRSDLSAIAEEKRAALPAVFWNALNASPEFEYYLRFDDQPLPLSQQPLEDRRALTALQQLTEVGNGLPAQLPPDRARLEAYFQALQQSQRSSQLIHSLTRLTHALQQAVIMLDSRQAQQLCPLGQPTAKSRILLTVFTTFYAGDIQPQMAQVQRLGQPWHATLTRLAEVPGIPPANVEYLSELQALWQTYQDSVKQHSLAWQQVLGACQMQPGQPGWQSPREQHSN